MGRRQGAISKSCWLLCSVHVSDGFPKKSLDGGWVGGVSSIQIILEFVFNFAKPLTGSYYE